MKNPLRGSVCCVFCQLEMAMKYLLLIYTDVQPLAALSPRERRLVTEAGRSNDEWLRTSGRLLAGAPLQAATAVTRVYTQQGELIVMAGPLLERALQPSAFYFIEARDLNDAIQMAAQLPQAHGGPLEVWPVAT